MAKLTIDGKEYNIETLTPDIANLINIIRYADSEIQRLQVQINMLSTARVVYIQKLKGLLEKLPKKS